MSVKRGVSAKRGSPTSLRLQPQAAYDLASIFVLRDAGDTRIPLEIETKAPPAEEVIAGLASVVSQKKKLKFPTPDAVRPIRLLIGFYRTAYLPANEFLLAEQARALDIGNFDRVVALAEKLSAALQPATYAALRIKEADPEQNSPEINAALRAADVVVGALNSCNMLPSALVALSSVTELVRNEIKFRRGIEEQAKSAILQAFGAGGDGLRFKSAGSQGAKMVRWVANKCLGEDAPPTSTMASRIQRKS